MRPAQLTPENAFFSCRIPASGTRFNEAGAINAGKRSSERVSVYRLDGFQ